MGWVPSVQRSSLVATRLGLDLLLHPDPARHGVHLGVVALGSVAAVGQERLQLGLAGPYGLLQAT